MLPALIIWTIEQLRSENTRFFAIRGDLLSDLLEGAGLYYLGGLEEHGDLAVGYGWFIVGGPGYYGMGRTRATGAETRS